MPMPSTGCSDNALLSFLWHFRVVPMALYPPKGLSERLEDAVSCPRRKPLFDPKMTLCGYDMLRVINNAKTTCQSVGYVA